MQTLHRFYLVHCKKKKKIPILLKIFALRLFKMVENGVRPVGWGSRIHRLHLYSEVRPLPRNEYPGWGIKQPDGEAQALELWEIFCHCSQVHPDPEW